MNWDQLNGNWKQVEGKIKEQWGKFTDGDLAIIKGKGDQLAGKIQEKYGVSKEEALKQANTFLETLKKIIAPTERPLK